MSSRLSFIFYEKVCYEWEDYSKIIFEVQIIFEVIFEDENSKELQICIIYLKCDVHS